MQTDELKKENYEGKIKRVKNLFKKRSDGTYSKNLFLVSQCVGAASLAGFIIGGRIGARVGAVEHIENTTLAVYASTVHAQREYQGRVFFGVHTERFKVWMASCCIFRFIQFAVGKL